MANVTFLNQQQPIDEYGRAVYAVARSIIRAMLDQVTVEDLADMNIDRGDLNLRQLAKVARLERDKGMRGDGFEWAVHEAILGEEPRVIEPVSDALKKLSRHLTPENISSVMFGHERAKYLGFLEAVIDTAGEDAVLLPDGRGHPYKFGPWVSRAARGKASEEILTARIQQVWKTDLFLTAGDQSKHVAATIKSKCGSAGGRTGSAYRYCS